jgi:hypothetical protein
VARLDIQAPCHTPIYQASTVSDDSGNQVECNTHPKQI